MDLQERMSELDRLFFRAMQRSNKFMVSDLPISKQQILLLRVVEAHKELTITELANLLDLSMSATTIAVNRLVDCGYLTRKRDSEDRRIVRIELTEKAEESVEQLKCIRNKMLAEMLGKLEPEEADLFVSLLKKMLL